MNPLNHVAIIMDGNGRWGIKYKNSRNAGHKAGLNTVEKIIKETIKHKIRFLTLKYGLNKMYSPYLSVKKILISFSFNPSLNFSLTIFLISFANSESES